MTFHNPIADPIPLRARLLDLLRPGGKLASLFLVGARFGGAGIGIVLQLIIARHLGAEALGQFYFALSFAGTLAIVLTLGYPFIIAPVVAEAQESDSRESLSAFMRDALQDLTLASLALGLPAAAFIWLWPWPMDGMQWIMTLALVTAPIYAVTRLYCGLANAVREFQKANLPELLLRPLIVLAMVAGFLALGLGLHAEWLVALNLVAALALMLWVAVLAPPRQPGTATGVLSRSIRARRDGSWLTLALPMVPAILFINLFTDLDLLMVGSLVPSELAGIFGATMKIASLFMFIVQILHQTMLRDLSDAWLQKDRGEVGAILGRANRAAFLGSLAAFVLVVLGGEALLGIFGEAFRSGYVCLVLLMASQLVRAALGPAGQLLMVAGGQKRAIKVYAVAIAFLFAANLALVPSFGIEGAAIAVLLTTLLWCAWLATLVWEMTGIDVTLISTRWRRTRVG